MKKVQVIQAVESPPVPTTKPPPWWAGPLVTIGLLLLACLVLSAFQCQSLCSKESYRVLPQFAAPQPRAALSPTDIHKLDVWVDMQMTGVYSPALTIGLGQLWSQTTSDEVKGLPSYLDELAAKGYIAVRVPHAPPTYSASHLDPGHGSGSALDFNYYMPPDVITRTTVTIPITRVTAYEATINARYPITNGRSHWEVWWIVDDEFPIPTDTFRLKDAWPQAIELMFQVDFGSGVATNCIGCSVELLVYNGYTFIGPFQAPLVIDTYQAFPGTPLAVFDQGCAGSFTPLDIVTPTVPFSNTHWLANYDTVTRTFNITASSSQGWAYTYYYGRSGQPLQRASLPFTVSVGPGVPGYSSSCVNISAVYTPTFPVTQTLREMFVITATSAVSPTTVRASASSVNLSPAYRLDEGLVLPLKLYLPLVRRN